MSDSEILDLGRSLQQAAPLDLRVNTLVADREEVLALLGKDGIEGSATPYSPIGIRLAGKPAINRHELFVTGKVEIQDEGSQLVGYLLGPERRDMGVDFCAGAGANRDAGALMRSQGRIYSLDSSEKRLNNLKRASSVRFINLYPSLYHENDIKVKRLRGRLTGYWWMLLAAALERCVVSGFEMATIATKHRRVQAQAGCNLASAANLLKRAAAGLCHLQFLA